MQNYKAKLKNVHDTLVDQKLDAILISSVANITYLTGFSSFSKDEREAFLFITKNKQFIITDGRYSEAVRSQVKNFELIQRSSDGPLKKIFEQLAKNHKIKKLGIEENNLTVSEYKMTKRYYNNTYHYRDIQKLRSVKSGKEISSIQKACKLGDKTFDFVLDKIKEGVSEKEIAFEIEFFIKKQGADTSFPPIVAFGKNSSVPHHQTGNTQLKKGDFALLDFGVKLNNYCSDMTRTVVFGKASSKQKKMHQTVLDAQQKAIEYLNEKCHSERSEESRSFDRRSQDDIRAREVDNVARSYITSKGYPSIPHSLGHGIGLEVHELPHLSPKSKDELKTGMVFSIEPGIYIPGFGGVRIEDLVVLERLEAGLLTHSQKTLIEL